MSRERVKQILDEDCKQRGLCEHESRFCSQIYPPRKLPISCFECHRNDSLTERIFQELPAQGETDDKYYRL